MKLAYSIPKLLKVFKMTKYSQHFAADLEKKSYRHYKSSDVKKYLGLFLFVTSKGPMNNRVKTYLAIILVIIPKL